MNKPKMNWVMNRVTAAMMEHEERQHHDDANVIKLMSPKNACAE